MIANLPFRKAFLQQWLNVKGGKAVVVLDKNKDCVVGYGQRRPCYREKTHQVGCKKYFRHDINISSALLYAGSGEQIFNLNRDIT